MVISLAVEPVVSLRVAQVGDQRGHGSVSRARRRRGRGDEPRVGGDRGADAQRSGHVGRVVGEQGLSAGPGGIDAARLEGVGGVGDALGKGVELALVTGQIRVSHL
jgi:hypothetical protein